MHPAAAMSFLGIDAGNIGHLWYLSNNPAIANFETGGAVPPMYDLSTSARHLLSLSTVRKAGTVCQ